MNELISKTEVIKDLEKDISESDNWLAIAIYMAFAIRIMSYKNIDAVEVVRCKDCKWFNKIGCAIMVADDSDKPTENDFCSFAQEATLVRCGTCKWLKPDGTCKVFADSRIRPSASDYCSYGERRTE